MRRLRFRRRNGVVCCVTIEVFRVEIEVMVRQGLLQPSHVQDRRAVKRAIGKVLDNWYIRS